MSTPVISSPLVLPSAASILARSLASGIVTAAELGWTVTVVESEQLFVVSNSSTTAPTHAP